MKTKLTGLTLLLATLAALTAILAQDESAEECVAEKLAAQQSILADYLTPDFEADYGMALANLFRLGALYQSMALQCGYSPNDQQVDVMLLQALDFVSLDDLLAAQSVGKDVEQILLELDELSGDPLTGQMLYNGLEPTLGGVALGCAGCHENDVIAPLTAGTWTRINDIRLKLPEFTDYNHRRYLVESIVQPMVYVAPEFAGVMPDFYGTQLTAQQLADLVAFLDSQDQLLDDE